MLALDPDYDNDGHPHHPYTPLLLQDLNSTPVYPIIHMIKEVRIAGAMTELI